VATLKGSLTLTNVAGALAVSSEEWRVAIAGVLGVDTNRVHGVEASQEGAAGGSSGRGERGQSRGRSRRHLAAHDVVVKFAVSAYDATELGELQKGVATFEAGASLGKLKDALEGISPGAKAQLAGAEMAVVISPIQKSNPAPAPARLSDLGVWLVIGVLGVVALGVFVYLVRGGGVAEDRASPPPAVAYTDTELSLTEMKS
jgi:hypothetical protein